MITVKKVACYVFTVALWFAQSAAAVVFKPKQRAVNIALVVLDSARSAFAICLRVESSVACLGITARPTTSNEPPIFYNGVVPAATCICV